MQRAAFQSLLTCTLITRISTRFNEFDICSAKTEADKETIHRSLGKNILAFLQRHKLGPALQGDDVKAPDFNRR